MVSNIEKEQIILKGFINKADIKKLRGNSNHYKAIEVFNKANALNGDDNYQDDRVVNVEHVLKVLGIDEKKIHRLAALERQIKKDAST